VLNAEMTVMRAGADQELAEQRQRVDELRVALDANVLLIDGFAGERLGLQARLEAARREAAEALQTADELRQADAGRRAQGPLARLRGAWRGA
jgi:hypothetical protein